MNAFTKLITAVFVTILISDVMTATAQSATPAKPAAAPTPPSGGTVATKKDQTPIETGTIKGRIVASDGQPLTNATIVAQALTGTPATKPTRPDAEGRFVFDELAPGTYLIIGTAPGYIDQSRALGDVSMWPRHLIGSNVKITMIKGGVITGLVSNAKGEPVVGVPVRATMTNPNASILGFFNGNGASETDDRGSYRIYGLLPGQYIVSA